MGTEPGSLHLIGTFWPAILVDESFDVYIGRQASSQKEICSSLRRLIFRMFPGIKEEMKFGVPWYGGRFYIAAFGDHVNLGVSVEGLPVEKLSLFEGEGRLMRHIKLFSEEEVARRRVRAVLKIAAESKCSSPPI